MQPANVRKSRLLLSFFVLLILTICNFNARARILVPVGKPNFLHAPELRLQRVVLNEQNRFEAVECKIAAVN